MPETLFFTKFFLPFVNSWVFFNNCQMRGLPFRVTEEDISEWFSSVADPVDIHIKLNAENRPSGEAEVTFASEGDAKRAMQKNKQNMQHRYIELFPM